MEHNDIRHKLSEYIDGSTTEQERTDIEAHLKTCRACGDALQELRKTIEQVKQIEEVEPPVWMTQKIMARVRAEAEEKRNFIQRFFHALMTNVPVRSVAVVFLAITAFYIYRNIQPAPGPTEAPVQELASGKQAAKDEPARAGDQLLRSKQTPQAPGYKALDMKDEYEKPAPPALMNQAAAPAPPTAAPNRGAETPMPPTDEDASQKTAAPQASAPAMVQEQAADGSLHAEKKCKAASPTARASSKTSADAIGTVISIRVKDTDTAVRELEQTVKQLEGSIRKRDLPDAKNVYEISIDARKVPQFKEKLKRIGAVKDEAVQPASKDGKIILSIELAMH